MMSSSRLKKSLDDHPRWVNIPDNKVRGANMGPTWVLLSPGGPHEPCYLGRHSDKCNNTNSSCLPMTVFLNSTWVAMTCIYFRQVNGVFEQMIFPIHLPDGQADSIWNSLAYLNLYMSSGNECLAACLTPSLLLTHCWLIVSFMFQNQLKQNFIWNKKRLILFISCHSLTYQLLRLTDMA